MIRFPLRERKAASIRAGAGAMAEDDITSVKPTPAPPDNIPRAPLSEPTSPGATIPRPADSLTHVGPPPAAAVEPEEVDIDPDPEPLETPTVPIETHDQNEVPRSEFRGPTSVPSIEIADEPESVAIPSSNRPMPIIDVGEAPPSVPPPSEPAPAPPRVVAIPPPPPAPASAPPPSAHPVSVPNVAVPMAPSASAPPSAAAVTGPPAASAFGDRGVHPVVDVGRAERGPPISAPPQARRPSSPAAVDAVSMPPAPSSRPRMSGEDLIVELFEALSDLALLHDPLEGADFVLRVALDHMPSAMAMVSFFSFDSREFVVVRAAGDNLAPGTLTGLLLKRVGDRAEIPSRAMRSQQTVVLDEDKASDALSNDPRWRAARIVPLHYMCAPIALGGRYLGLLEIANPSDGVAFSAADGHALTYMGQQLAEFLAQRDLVLDPERITAPRLAARVRRS